MNSPNDMKIIQIDITNACSFNCSNCTRFCGMQKNNYFMDFETFKKAVDSLKDFKGIVGVMGGEPTLHPEFDKFISYLHQQRPEYRPHIGIKVPVPSFKYYFNKVWYRTGKRSCLFTSLGSGYYKNFELIQDIFSYQNINEHIGINNHQGILIPRKELGISDEEFYEKRDKCWLQNLWSASITPKGAFYCEIAATMDMLFDGPGGWDVTSDWWKRTPKDFKDQIHWCENCAMALDVPTIEAKLQTDLISPEMEKKLKKINGWKMQNGKYKVFNPQDYGKVKSHKYDSVWYFQNGEKERVSNTFSSLYPKKIDVAVLEGSSDIATISKQDVEKLNFDDFLIVFPNEKSVDMNIIERMKKCIFNPGFFYDLGCGIFIINSRAIALKNKTSIVIDKNLYKLWQKNKVSKIKAKNLGKLTVLQKIFEFAGKLFNKAAFIIPIKLSK